MRDAEVRLALLVILSFLFTTLSDPFLGEVLAALQMLARSHRRVPHCSCDAFLTSPAKAALGGSQNPSSTLRRSISIGTLSVWRELAEPAPHHSGRTLARNLGCLRTSLIAALFLAGTLGPSWSAVLEAVPNADYVLPTGGTAPGSPPIGTGAFAGTPSKRGGTHIEGLWNSSNTGIRRRRIHPLQTSISESVQATA